jgi:hypothetical protein
MTVLAESVVADKVAAYEAWAMRLTCMVTSALCWPSACALPDRGRGATPRRPQGRAAPIVHADCGDGARAGSWGKGGRCAPCRSLAAGCACRGASCPLTRRRPR